ncbi:MAG: ABC transporter ATP-binding protein [Thaumarchaeota archaeon]|nr:ABC transporter ATP-binding protein [Nitrososphaerota archaeon]
MENIVLQTVNLSKTFNSSITQVIALKNVNISIKKGEFVAIVGPSGSGKSTLLNLLGALDRPSRGKVLIDGIDIFSLNDNDVARLRNKKIGFVFQSYNLINRTTVLRNIEIPSIIRGIPKEKRINRATNILKLLGIDDKADFKPGLLSGGEQQRVAIARSLMNNPSIILADEPTGNLDTKTGQEVFDLLKDLSHKYNRTIVMVTHNPELANATERSIYIRDGMIEKEIINQ